MSREDQKDVEFNVLNPEIVQKREAEEAQRRKEQAEAEVRFCQPWSTSMRPRLGCCCQSCPGREEEISHGTEEEGRGDDFYVVYGQYYRAVNRKQGRLNWQKPRHERNNKPMHERNNSRERRCITSIRPLLLLVMSQAAAAKAAEEEKKKRALEAKKKEQVGIACNITLGGCGMCRKPRRQRRRSRSSR